MRDIKFRAWDDVSKVMSFSNFEQFDDMMGFRFSHFETEKPIYMQCTGLSDKNGKEIYEGDILEYKKFYYFDESDKKARDFVGYSTEYVEWTLGNSLLNKIYRRCEVIGNIYKNPDLIQGGGE
ncbi:hypothetical protein EEL30_19885 [Brevibacillus laterosporus]|uniref:YopX protein domain-containing protein n=1 Tax=Brevibacillus laterosporus TaxID=1465 RepID=A0A518VBI1_BRELA|nr:hypothetical protein EEL30_19885 [Brevibacillus laterosporus]